MSDSHPSLLWIKSWFVELGEGDKQGEVESFQRWLFWFSSYMCLHLPSSSSSSGLEALEAAGKVQSGVRRRVGKNGEECKAGRDGTGECLPCGCLPCMPDHFS